MSDHDVNQRRCPHDDWAAGKAKIGVNPDTGNPVELDINGVASVIALQSAFMTVSAAMKNVPGYPQWQNKVAPSKSLAQCIKDQKTKLQQAMTIDALKLQGYSDEQIAELMDSGSPGPDPPPVVYECEADKPEGERDVDKFLKEQQEKLWRSD